MSFDAVTAKKSKEMNYFVGKMDIFATPGAVFCDDYNFNIACVGKNMDEANQSNFAGKFAGKIKGHAARWI